MKDEVLRNRVEKMQSEIARLQDSVSYLRSSLIPTEGLVLEWVARDRDKKRRERHERAICAAIILLLVGSLLWSIGSAITWVAS